MKLIPVLLAVALSGPALCLAQDAAPPAAPAAPAAPDAPATPAAPAVPARPVLDATNVTPDEAEKLIAETPGLIVIDVRTPEEFEHGHIKGAVNANLFDAGFEDQIAAMDQTKPVIIHCQSGRRSSQALMDLAGKAKFPKVYHLATGFKGWKDAKKPVEGQPLPGAGRLAPGNKPSPRPAK